MTVAENEAVKVGDQKEEHAMYFEDYYAAWGVRHGVLWTTGDRQCLLVQILTTD
jgi:hypothetical protein